MRLTNVVVQGDLGCNIDLRELTYKLGDVRYDPRKFPAVIWQHRKIGGNALVFSNGKINCNVTPGSYRSLATRLTYVTSELSRRREHTG